MNYDPNKNKSMGYDPIPSTGNNTGYYMGEQSNLMGMMQTGGNVNPLIARALQMRSDQDRLDSLAKDEGKRQKRSGLFGSIGSFGGGLLGAALAPFTGGVSIPIMAGIGSALGKGAGEYLGAGKATEVDTEGTVFGQKSFRDIEDASSDYNEGMLERAGVAGLKTGITAGITPGGGIYGKAGKFGEKLQAGSIPFSDSVSYASGITPNDSGFLIPDSANAEILSDLPVSDFDTSLLDAGTDVTEQAYQDSLSNAISLGEYNKLLEAGRIGVEGAEIGRDASSKAQKLIDLLKPSIATDFDYTPLFDKETIFSSPKYNPLQEVPDYLSSTDYSMPLVGGGSLQYEDGGEVQNYQYGGFTAEDVFKESGLMPSSDQLGLFESFDPTRIQSATQDISESLLGMTGGQGIASQGGSGFGAQESMVNRLLSQSQQGLESEIESEQSRFARDVQRQIAEDIRLGVEYDEYDPEALRQLYLENQARGRGSTGGRHYSDLRLKKDIHLIGKSIQGLNIYNFKYKDKSYRDETHQGVMAQEVPWASFKMNNGYLAVDYSKVDVDFKKVN